MKTMRMEMVVYYEMQDSTTKEEAEDVIIDLAEIGGLKIVSYKADIVKDEPDND